MTNSKAKRVSTSRTMHIPAPPETIFPLLCPVQEYKWIPTWDCDLIYSDSGVAELGCIFKTAFSQDGPEDTWTVSRYEPPEAIAFIRVNSSRVMHYEIFLTSVPGGETLVAWNAVLTALNPEGSKLLDTWSAESFIKRNEALEKMLKHFLSTGTMLKTSL